jgi:predicted ATPase/DNA-binding SARP family transcriptional activator
MEFRMLGPLEVRSGGETLALGGAKQRALLAILLLQPNHVVTRERLAELLWGDEPPPTADHVIEVYVSQLRRALEPAGAPYKLLVRKPAGYVLQVEASDIDATQFTSLVESAKGLEPSEAVAHLQRALEMWRGPALADFAGESFAVSEAARLNELRLYATEERIEAELKLGHHGRLIGELQGLVEQHPLRERLCGQLMLALYRSGRQAEASDVYQKTRERLVDELGMEPGPELQDLLKRILQQESGLAPAAPAAPSLPTGMVTFLLTDLEGSTRRWERNPTAMQQAMEIHDAVLGRVINAHAGMQVESGREGDSILAAFRRATDALACGVEIQTSLAAETWPEGADLHIRVAIHTGEAELRGGHYFGPALHRCGRLLATGHGDQVLLTQATHDVVVDTLRGGMALRDLGLHRLRDLERPERIFQVTGPGLRSEFPPLNSLDPRRHNLPISPTRFIGREKELADISERLAAHRMLTLVGPGGTGKTRLALQAAADNIDRFADGVWFVELASVREPDLVAQTVAEALGVREEPGRPLIKSVVDRCRERKFLLVLDNCEHLVHAVVQIVDKLLRDCPNVCVLATSRAQLRLNGETIVRVGPLEESEAVALFTERATSVSPGFRMTAQDDESAVQICHRVQGIPLAIELAAGRAHMLTPAEILARLQESFSVLAGGSRSAEARHETLKAALDWSYRLLTEEEQRLLRLISVFAGGFTLGAAESVNADVAEGSTLDLLGQLVDKSLVAPQESVGGVTRYSVLETVRAYGRDRLVESGELAAAQMRHAEYFVRFALAAHPELAGPNRRTWLHRLGDEVDNFRAIFEVQAVPAAMKLELAAGLDELWDARGEYSEGRARLEAALKAASRPTNTRARALRAVGLMSWAQGDQIAAKSYTDQALALSRRLRDEEEEASSLQQLGQIAVQLGQFADARHHLEAALAIAARTGSERTQAVCEWRLGMADLFEKDFGSAGVHIKAGLDLARRQSDEEMIALSLLMLGYIELWNGHVDEARSKLLESLQMLSVHGSNRSIANLLQALAVVADEDGETERALTLGGATEALRSKIAMAPSSPLHHELGSRLEALRKRHTGSAAWESGLVLGRDEAIRYALDVGVKAGRS